MSYLLSWCNFNVFCRFDVALDYAGDESALSCVRPQGWFVTARNPLLQTIDDKGLLLGGAFAATRYSQKALQVGLQSMWLA